MPRPANHDDNLEHQHIDVIHYFDDYGRQVQHIIDTLIHGGDLDSVYQGLASLRRSIDADRKSHLSAKS